MTYPAALCSAVAFAFRLGLLVGLGANPAWAGLPQHPRVQQGAPAPWVETHPRPTQAPSGEARAVHYLRVDEQVRVAGSRSVRYAETVVAIGSPEGLQEGAQWQVDFEPSFQRLVVHDLEVYRNGRWSDRLTATRGSIMQREEELDARVYDESLTLLLVTDDVRVGDLVRFAYSLIGANPVFGERYIATFSMAWGTPVAARHLRLLSDADNPLPFRDPLSPAPARTLLRPGGTREIRWDLHNVPEVESETREPHGWTSRPMVQVSQFGSWQEVVEWALPLYQVERPPPREVREVANALRATHPTEAERFLAALQFVQDEVRYFAAAVGTHSHRPHDTAETLRRRYGDCKDKTRLLIDLLAALEIPAWPAFVDTDLHGGVNQWLPSPGAFDHVIAVAEVAGRTVWVDPTQSLQGGDVDTLFLPPYEAALEVRPGVAGLTTLPAEQSRRGPQRVHYDYQVGEVGEPLSVAITTTFLRQDADDMRRRLADTTPQDLLAEYVDYYSDDEVQVEPAAPLVIHDDRRANRIEITERYRMLGCWGENRGGGCDLLPLLMSSHIEVPDVKTRRAPWRLGPAQHTHEVVALHSRQGWNFEPVDVLQQTPWFKFQVTSQPKDDGLEIRYEYKHLATAVDPDEIVAFAKATRAVHDRIGYRLGGTDVGTEGSTSKTRPNEFHWGLIAGLIGGCFLLPLGLAVTVVVLIVRALRRRPAPNPAAPSPPDGAPAVAPAVLVTAPPGPLAQRRSSALPVVLVLAAGGALVLVAVIGVIAAILIPNFQDALQKAKQKRTHRHLVGVSDRLHVYYAEHGGYPPVTMAELPQALGSPDMPVVDGWKHPLVYQCYMAEPEAELCADFRIASPGRDGELEFPHLQAYEKGQIPPGAYDEDLVLAPLEAVRYP